MAKIRLYKPEESASQILGNSQSVSNGDLVALVSGFLIKAINTTVRPIVGCANGTLAVASDNQTVAKNKMSYTRFEPYESRFEFTTSAAIAQADVGKYYALTSAGIVDVATASATVAAGSVVRLEAITTSTTTGVFVAIV